jgi:hypothetical protein
MCLLSCAVSPGPRLKLFRPVSRPVCGLGVLGSAALCAACLYFVFVLWHLALSPAVGPFLPSLSVLLYLTCGALCRGNVTTFDMPNTAVYGGQTLQKTPIRPCDGCAMPLLCSLTHFAVSSCGLQCTGLVEKHFCNTIHWRAAMATRLQGLSEQQLLILGHNSTPSIIISQEDDLLAPLYVKRIALLVTQTAPPGPVTLRRTCRCMHTHVNDRNCRQNIFCMHGLQKFTLLFYFNVVLKCGRGHFACTRVCRQSLCDMFTSYNNDDATR